jgi:ribonuclease PH
LQGLSPLRPPPDADYASRKQSGECYASFGPKPRRNAPDFHRDRHATKHAEGSCLIKCGATQVLCTASLEERVPPFLKNTGLGWVTAEYGMLPRATHTRMRREARRASNPAERRKFNGLSGAPCARASTVSALGERQITVDCDVIQADGGTRCASITGGWVALRLAVNKLLKAGDIISDPITDHVAAVSCGIYAGQPVLDLDYPRTAKPGRTAISS